MYLNAHKWVIIYFGWLIPSSYSIECLQCTSPIQRTSGNWDYSCLDGTLRSSICVDPINNNTAQYQKCATALYRIKQGINKGVFIQRTCTLGHTLSSDCDPPNATLNNKDIAGFYCQVSCSANGCNRHLVTQIIRNSGTLLKANLTALHVMFLMTFCRRSIIHIS